MSAYKQLTSKDIIVTPFTVHASASNIDNNTVSKFSGSNASHTVTGSFPTNTIIGTSSVALVYNSIKQLFYSNYLEKANNEDGLPLKGLVSKEAHLVSTQMVLLKDLSTPPHLKIILLQ